MYLKCLIVIFAYSKNIAIFQINLLPSLKVWAERKCDLVSTFIPPLRASNWIMINHNAGKATLRRQVLF